MPTRDCKPSEVGVAFRQYSARLRRAAEESLLPAAQRGLEIVLEDIPIVSGALAASGDARLVYEGGAFGADLVFGGDKAPYALFVELGTEHMEPRAFVGKHLREMEAAVQDEIERRLGEGG